MCRVKPHMIRLVLIAGLAANPVHAEDLKDLYFGEALYYAHQGYFFDALVRLDTEVKPYGEVD